FALADLRQVEDGEWDSHGWRTFRRNGHEYTDTGTPSADRARIREHRRSPGYFGATVHRSAPWASSGTSVVAGTVAGRGRCLPDLPYVGGVGVQGGAVGAGRRDVRHGDAVPVNQDGVGLAGREGVAFPPLPQGEDDGEEIAA